MARASRAEFGGHRLVEILGLVGALGKEVEGMLAISLAHAVLTGAKTIEECS